LFEVGDIVVVRANPEWGRDNDDRDALPFWLAMKTKKNFSFEGSGPKEGLRRGLHVTWLEVMPAVSDPNIPPESTVYEKDSMAA
jgi:hypothetical protein